MKIGNFETESDIFLAPMAGLTGSAVRRFLKKIGAGLVFTEMISVQSLVRLNSKTLSLLKYESDEKPIGAQLFGNEVKYFVNGAKIIYDMGFDLIDLNCGCPARKIVKNKNGVMLMNSPEVVAEIITRIKEATGLPVSIKIRLGIKDNDNLIFKFLEKINNAPLDLITVHIRYAENFHKGIPDLEIAKKIRDFIKVKYVINGSIDSPEKAKEIIEKTSCDGLMIGRPAFLNLLLFKQINDLFKEKSSASCRELNINQKYSKIMKQFFIEIATEDRLGRLKKMVPYVIKNDIGSKELRIKLLTSKTIEDFLKILDNQ